MPTPFTTEVQVYNLALDHLAERPLTATTDATAYGRWLTRNMDQFRDAITRAHIWNFATKLNTLTEDATAPAFKWAARYALPTDWLRVLQPMYLGGRLNNPLPFEVIDNFIYCDQTTTLYLRTIQRITDITKWDPLAIDAWALSAAVRMTYRFTALASLRDRLKEDFVGVIRTAREMDAFEGTPEPVEQHTVIDVRDD